MFVVEIRQISGATEGAFIQVGVVVLEILCYSVSTVGKCLDTRGMVGVECVRWLVYELAG